MIMQWDCGAQLSSVLLSILHEVSVYATRCWRLLMPCMVDVVAGVYEVSCQVQVLQLLQAGKEGVAVVQEGWLMGC